MSNNGRRFLSQEELEIHNVLSPSVTGSQRGAEDTVVIDQQPNVLNAEALDLLIQEAISKGIRTGIRQAHSQPSGEDIQPIPQVHNQPDPVDAGLAQNVDQDLPDVGMNNVREDMASHVIFGENVNEEPMDDTYDEEEDVDDPYFPPGQNPPNAQVPTSFMPNLSQNPPNTQAPTPLVPNLTSNEVDSDLSAAHPRPPPNWHP